MIVYIFKDNLHCGQYRFDILFIVYCHMDGCVHRILEAGAIQATIRMGHYKLPRRKRENPNRIRAQGIEKAEQNNWSKKSF